MNHASKPLLGMIAMGAALAMPVAFAQDASLKQDPQDPTMHAPPPEAATSQELTWADLDADGNGTLDRNEAARVQALAQAFDEIDGNGDGQLTAEEYKDHLAKLQSAPPEADNG